MKLTPRFIRRSSVAPVLTSNKMQDRLLFFATLKDIVGAHHMQIDVPCVATVADVVSKRSHTDPRTSAYRPASPTPINEEYLDQPAVLHAGDEVASFPPVSGGALDSEVLIIRRPGEHYEITRE